MATDDVRAEARAEAAEPSGPEAAAPGGERAAGSPRWVRNLGSYAVLTVLSLVVLIPIWFTFVRAISSQQSLVNGSALVPHDVEWGVFRVAWDRGNLGGAMVRSLVVTVIITSAQLVTSTMAAYAFAFLRFPLKRFIFAVFMATLLLPLEVTLLPNLHTIASLGWFDSYQGLTVPFLATALGTFLIRQGFLGIPSELRDAVRLEGWGHWSFMWKFAVPLSRPVIASFGVIAFLGAFNQYLWPRAVVNEPDQWSTIQIALRGLSSSADQLNISIAGAVIAAIPVVILLILFQRHIVRGLTAGAVKG
jgi:sn-glycerol 3-phosphate transport system permease protein